MADSEKQKSELKSHHWSELPERGAVFGIRLLMWIYRLLGRRVAEVILFFTIGYFFLTGCNARKASYQYLTRVFEYGTNHPKLQKRPTYRTVFYHFLTFGKAALDKVSSWTGQITHQDISFENQKLFIEKGLGGRGGIIIGSHLGNLEVLRALVNEINEVKINVMVFTKNAMKYNSILNQLNPAVTQRLIHVESIGPDTAIYLKQKVDEGEFIAIVSDRTAILSKDHISYANFLGELAPFSQGPLILAKILECPVYLLFCLKKEDRFHASFEVFLDQVVISRKEKKQKFQEIIQDYATRLEHYCLQEPFQWFNFFDFWTHHRTQSIDRFPHAKSNKSKFHE